MRGAAYPRLLVGELTRGCVALLLVLGCLTLLLWGSFWKEDLMVVCTGENERVWRCGALRAELERQRAARSPEGETG